MRFSIVLGILAAILFLPSTAAYADPITTFTFAGTWEEGSTPYGASGTVTVDTGTGAVQAIDLTFQTLASDAVVAGTMSNSYGPPLNFTEIGETWLGPQGVNYYAAIDLLLPTPTLVGYAGGNICSMTNPCAAGASIVGLGIADYDFISGTLTATPEPSSLSFLCIGVLTMIGTQRGRLFRTPGNQTPPAQSA